MGRTEGLCRGRAPAPGLGRLVLRRSAALGLSAALALLALASAAWAEAPRAAPPVAVGAELSSEGAKTRLSVLLSGAVAARSFVTERPSRVIVELPEINFQIPPEASRREGSVASFRTGLFARERSRIVIDLAQPALVSRLDVSERADGAYLLTIELQRADREAFRRAAVADERALAGAQAAARPAAPDDRRPLIVIDPGHGGADPGARAVTGDVEKDIVFAFAQHLQRRLDGTGRYRTALTRDRDVFVALDERVRRARLAKADLFVSIHADSISEQPHVRGLTVYTGAEQASDAESAHLADRENEADRRAGHEAGHQPDEVSDILHELTLRETRGLSHRFAGKLIGDLRPVMGLNARPHREARFRVLRAPDVPAVLVELGYLSSRKDIGLLTSEGWRERTAAAMTSAVDRFFATQVAARAAPPRAP